jgi:hypothetical protein
VAINITTHGAAAAARFLVTGSAPVVTPARCSPLVNDSANLTQYRHEWRSLIGDRTPLNSHVLESSHGCSVQASPPVLNPLPGIGPPRQRHGL